MKSKAITLLLIFLSFVAIPTIMVCVNNDVDISSVYTITEEENHGKTNPGKYFNDYMSEVMDLVFILASLNKKKICEEFLLKHDNAFQEIFSPPPEQKLV